MKKKNRLRKCQHDKTYTDIWMATEDGGYYWYCENCNMSGYDKVKEKKVEEDEE